MPEVTARVALAVLAAVFAWAAAAKMVRRSAWRRALDGYSFPRSVVALVLWVTPFAEGLVVVLALVGYSRAAAAVAFVLLGAFTGALMRARALRGESVPCGCFGKTAERPVSLMLWRNAGLAVCALVVFADPGDVQLFADVRAPRAGEALAVALVVIGLALAAWAARVGLASMGGRRT